jgi:hypothetical protein
MWQSGRGPADSEAGPVRGPTTSGPEHERLAIAK